MAGYSFKVNELVTVDGTTIKPKKITVFIGLFGGLCGLAAR